MAVATASGMLAETLLEFPAMLLDDAGREYAARACGLERDDGLWEGWIELEGDGTVLRTGRETTQPNRADLAYWASGLTDVYLEGALRRATRPAATPAPRVLSAPTFDGPAEPVSEPSDRERLEPVMNPFATYARGEEPLRRQLAALAPWHLRTIARAHALVPSVGLAATMSRDELVEAIVRGVRDRAASPR